jgi:pimeloyl-ACP methyl ester carboxylesterase
MTLKGFEGWPYVVHVPEHYRGDEPLPLLFWLTGGPGRATLGLSQARDTLARSEWLVVYPHAPDLWWTEPAARTVAALLDEVLRRFNVDTDRVYVAGMSNGGTGAYRYATLWPDRFAAAVSLMGAGQYVRGGEQPLAANLAGFPILFAHGDSDPVIPKIASEEALKAVREAAPGAQPELRILPGRGHDLDLASDAALVEAFLAGRARNPFPRSVRLAIRDLRDPRRYWVEVLDKQGGVAEVEGAIGDDNTLTLRTRRVRRLRLLLRREHLPGSGPLRVVLDGREVFSGPLPEDCELLRRTAKEGADPQRAWSAELSFEAGS